MTNKFFISFYLKILKNSLIVGLSMPEDVTLNKNNNEFFLNIITFFK